MWTATWTLGGQRLSIQCQPKQSRAGREALQKTCSQAASSREKRARSQMKYWQIDSSSASQCVYPTQAKEKGLLQNSHTLARLSAARSPSLTHSFSHSHSGNLRFMNSRNDFRKHFTNYNRLYAFYVRGSLQISSDFIWVWELLVREWERERERAR